MKLEKFMIADEDFIYYLQERSYSEIEWDELAIEYSKWEKENKE